MGMRRVGGKTQEGIGKRKMRKRMEGVQRDFKYGLQNIHVGLVGDVLGHAEGSIE